MSERAAPQIVSTVLGSLNEKPVRWDDTSQQGFMMRPNEKVQRFKHQYIKLSVWKCVIPLSGDELDEKSDDTPQHMINNLFFLIFSFWALSVLKGGFCSLWTQLLTVASYLMDRRERDIDLLAELSARKRVSVYHKMSNYSFNCCKSDMLQDFGLSRLNFGSLVLGTILSWMIWY